MTTHHDTEPMTIESAVEEMCAARICVFNAELDRSRAEMMAAGIDAAGIDRAHREVLAHFIEVLTAEARRLARDLDGVLPRRSGYLH